MHYYYYDHNLTATTIRRLRPPSRYMQCMPRIFQSHLHFRSPTPTKYISIYLHRLLPLSHSLLLLTTILYLGNITYSHTRFAIYLRLQERRKIKMRIERDRQRASERETENGILLCRACSPKSAPSLNPKHWFLVF